MSLFYTGVHKVAADGQNCKNQKTTNVVAFPKYVVVSDKYKLPVLGQCDNLSTTNFSTSNGLDDKVLFSPVEVKLSGTSIERPVEPELGSCTLRWQNGFPLGRVRCKSSPRYGFGIEHEIQSLRRRLLNTRVTTAPLASKRPQRQHKATMINEKGHGEAKSKRAVTCINLSLPQRLETTKSHSPPPPRNYPYNETFYPQTSRTDSESASMKHRPKSGYLKSNHVRTNVFAKVNPAESNTTQTLLEKSITQNVLKFPSNLKNLTGNPVKRTSQWCYTSLTS